MTDPQLHELKVFLAQNTCFFKRLVTPSAADSSSSLSELSPPSASPVKAHGVTSPKRKETSPQSSLPPATSTKGVESTLINPATAAQKSQIIEATANTDGSSLGGSPPKLKRKAIGSPLMSHSPDPSPRSVEPRSDGPVARSSPTKQNKKRKLVAGGSASASTSTSSGPETPEQITTKKALLKISQSRRAQQGRK